MSWIYFKHDFYNKYKVELFKVIESPHVAKSVVAVVVAAAELVFADSVLVVSPMIVGQ